MWASMSRSVTDSAERFIAMPPSSPSWRGSCSATLSSTRRAVSPVSPQGSAPGREARGADQVAVVLVDQPHERLVVGNATVGERHDRLVVQDEQVSRERA